jgi:photosystem II stability/assembly factor-like uncharacterized protein
MTIVRSAVLPNSVLKRAASYIRKHSKISVAVAATFLLLGSGTIVAAVTSPSSTIGSVGLTNATSVNTTWSTPSNEMSAPQIAIAGGAVVGSGNFNSMTCPSSSLCVAVGGDNSLLGVAATSTNGGATWNSATLVASTPELDSIACSSLTSCVAVGQGASAQSNDGGVTWTSHTIPSANTTLLGVSCPSSKLCVSVGVIPGNTGPYGGQVLLSTDGGITWAAPPLPQMVGALGSVSCPSSTFCVAVGAQILVTNDGGKTWATRFVSGGTGVLRSVSCVSDLTCVAIGPNPAGLSDASSAAFAIVTTDGGSTWSQQSMPSGSAALNTITCNGASVCAVSGQSLNSSVAPMWVSGDGGTSWHSAALPPGVTAVSSVNCQSATTCEFVGRQTTAPVSGASSTSVQWTVTTLPLAVVTQSAVGS